MHVRLWIRRKTHDAGVTDEYVDAVSDVFKDVCTCLPHRGKGCEITPDEVNFDIWIFRLDVVLHHFGTLSIAATENNLARGLRGECFHCRFPEACSSCLSVRMIDSTLADTFSYTTGHKDDSAL